MTEEEVHDAKVLLEQRSYLSSYLHRLSTDLRAVAFQIHFVEWPSFDGSNLTNCGVSQLDYAEPMARTVAEVLRLRLDEVNAELRRLGVQLKTEEK